MPPIDVMIVDDSAYIRQMFSQFLGSDPSIRVVATAADPLEAREKIKQFNPHVLTLDVEMPKMDGLRFLQKIMTLRPMPVVMVSSLTQRGADITLQAMELGAVDYLGKPENPSHLDAIKAELIRKVKQAALARPKSLPTTAQIPSTRPLIFSADPTQSVIAIGASTGGVEAIREVVQLLPSNSPPIVTTQHMPPVFTKSFANRLSGLTQLNVREADDGMVLEPGTMFIAPGGRHLQVKRSGKKFICAIDDSPPVSSHKPSVDRLFFSVAHEVGDRAVAAILTGMGKDGADGLLAIRLSGGRTIGQNEASCVVYGMPRAAMLCGAVEDELPLQDIAATILKRCSTMTNT